MCYDTAFPPDRIEYVCPSCGEKTLYARKEHGEEQTSEVEDNLRATGRDKVRAYDRVEEIAKCRGAIKDIQGIKAELDESQFCRRCRPNVEDPVLFLKVFYANVSKITPDVRYKDLLLLTDFMQGNPQTLGCRQALADHLPRLEELLGVKMDG